MRFRASIAFEIRPSQISKRPSEQAELHEVPTAMGSVGGAGY